LTNKGQPLLKCPWDTPGIDPIRLLDADKIHILGTPESRPPLVIKEDLLPISPEPTAKGRHLYAKLVRYCHPPRRHPQRQLR
jgi:hypothetical protein